MPVPPWSSSPPEKVGTPDPSIRVSFIALGYCSIYHLPQLYVILVPLSQLMSANDSISRWLEQLKAGDRQPVRHMLSRYFQRVQALADARLGRAAHLDGMEEDI